MLRDIDGKEALTIIFDAVYVDKEVRVDVSLHFDTVYDEASLSWAIWTVYEDITAACKQGSELENFHLFFFPSRTELILVFFITFVVS